MRFMRGKIKKEKKKKTIIPTSRKRRHRNGHEIK